MLLLLPPLRLQMQQIVCADIVVVAAVVEAAVFVSGGAGSRTIALRPSIRDTCRRIQYSPPKL